MIGCLVVRCLVVYRMVAPTRRHCAFAHRPETLRFRDKRTLELRIRDRKERRPSPASWGGWKGAIPSGSESCSDNFCSSSVRSSSYTGFLDLLPSCGGRGAPPPYVSSWLFCWRGLRWGSSPFRTRPKATIPSVHGSRVPANITAPEGKNGYGSMARERHHAGGFGNLDRGTH